MITIEVTYEQLYQMALGLACSISNPIPIDGKEDAEEAYLLLKRHLEVGDTHILDPIAYPQAPAAWSQ